MSNGRRVRTGKGYISRHTKLARVAYHLTGSGSLVSDDSRKQHAFLTKVLGTIGANVFQSLGEVVGPHLEFAFPQVYER